MITLYDFHESGNAYKVRLLLSQLQQPFRRVEVDILKGETRTPQFLARNPNHRVPVVEWPDGRCLAESNAILFHLAEGSELLPADPWQRALALQWMFFEQYSHEPYIAVLRFWHFAGLLEQNADQVAAKKQRGYEALAVMAQHLASRQFFVGERYGIADIALYAYTHVAHEGGFDLAAYPAVLAWLARVRQQPRYIPITD